MAFPTFAPGDVLNASDMNAVGLWLIKSDTIAAGSSSHVITGAFNADYNDYLIVARGLSVASGTPNLIGQLRIGASTTTTSYYWGGFNNNFTNRTDEQSSNTTSWRIGIVSTTIAHVLFIWISSPFVAARTNQYNYGSSTVTAWVNGGYQNDTTSFDQFVISPASSTLSSGTIRVYGIRN